MDETSFHAFSLKNKQKNAKKCKISVDLVGYTDYNVGMPGQRAANKKQFTAAFTVDELKSIDEAAKREGITRTEFLRRAAHLLLNKDEATKTNNNNTESEK